MGASLCKIVRVSGRRKSFVGGFVRRFTLSAQFEDQRSTVFFKARVVDCLDALLLGRFGNRCIKFALCAKAKRNRIFGVISAMFQCVRSRIA